MSQMIIKNWKKLDLISIDDSDKKRKLQIKSKVSKFFIIRIGWEYCRKNNRKEIHNELYEHINEYNWKDENDFLKAHTLMMRYFGDDNGYYRNHGEGVKKGNELIYLTPQDILERYYEKNKFLYKIRNYVLSNLQKNYIILLLENRKNYFFVMEGERDNWKKFLFK